MKKLVKVIFVLTMFGLLFIICPKTVVLANETEIPKGVLVMDDRGVSLTKSEGYFFNLTDLFPGDTITREIEVKNDRSEDIGIVINVMPIKFTGPINLIKMIDMKWTYEDKVIFDGNLASESKKIADKGSSIYLGKLPANSVRHIVVDLDVSSDIPVKDLLNEPSEATVKWDVKATTEDIKKPIVKPLIKEPGIKKIFPKTGENHYPVLSLLGIILMVLVIILSKKLYKRNDTE